MRRVGDRLAEAEAILLPAATFATETESVTVTGTGTATFEMGRRFAGIPTATGAAGIVWIVISMPATPAMPASEGLGAHGLRHAIPAIFEILGTQPPLGTAILFGCAVIREIV